MTFKVFDTETNTEVTKEFFWWLDPEGKLYYCASVFEDSDTYTAPPKYKVIPVLETETKHVCSECAEFIGCGDWDLCCKNPPKELASPFGFLCYEDSPSCRNFKPKGA